MSTTHKIAYLIGVVVATLITLRVLQLVYLCLTATRGAH